MELKKLDKVFSEYIRRRYADEDGMVKCATCLTELHWKQLDCGHFRVRANISTRWDEYNAAQQCRRCNGSEDGMYDDMWFYLVSKFVIAEMAKVIGRSRTAWKPMQYEIDKLTEYYKNKLKGI